LRENLTGSSLCRICRYCEVLSNKNSNLRYKTNTFLLISSSFLSKSNYLIRRQLESSFVSRGAIRFAKMRKSKKSLPPYRAVSAVFTPSPVFLEIRHTFEILSCGSRRSFELCAALFEYVCRCYPCGKAAESGAAAL